MAWESDCGIAGFYILNYNNNIIRKMIAKNVGQNRTVLSVFRENFKAAYCTSIMVGLSET